MRVLFGRSNCWFAAAQARRCNAYDKHQRGASVSDLKRKLRFCQLAAWPAPIGLALPEMPNGIACPDGSAA